MVEEFAMGRAQTGTRHRCRSRTAQREHYAEIAGDRESADHGCWSCQTEACVARDQNPSLTAMSNLFNGLNDQLGSSMPAWWSCRSAIVLVFLLLCPAITF